LTSERATAPAARAFEFEPHNCFACGSLNEHGLHLDLHLGERRSWTELTLEPRFEGWVGIAHGGIIATILDEVMAWALVAEENWGVTARMTIDYRRPITVGTPIRGEGWIVRSRRRLVDTAGRIVDADGNVLAEAEAIYVAADEARKQELRARYGYRVRTARDTGAVVDTDGAGEVEPTHQIAGATPDMVAPGAPAR
jgi:uncharacterized protein (TIGR00369 family)